MKNMATYIIIAIIGGLLLGLFLSGQVDDQGNFTSTAQFLIGVIKPFGELFIRLLKMIIVPLITASIIMGVVSVGSMGRLGKIGSITFGYYITTTVLAIVLGLIMVNIIQPGKGVNLQDPEISQQMSAGNQIVAAKKFDDYSSPTITSLMKDLVPVNIIGAMAEGKMLSVIFFSILFGVVIVAIGDKGQPLIEFFRSLDEAMMTLTNWIMYLAPIGAFSLMTITVAQTGSAVITCLAKYMSTVLISLFIHSVVVLPILLMVFGRRSPLKFLGCVSPALATAFSTSSSAATLPLTMNCLEKRAKVSESTVSFVMPLGATINMDGTALYEAVAAMFIAQAYGIDLTIAQQAMIVLTATLASIGAAAIPSAGLFTLVIVLNAVGLSAEGIGLILAVDRILDMCRTTVNVWGDSCGSAVVERMRNIGNK